MKRSEGKRALPSLSETSNLPKIANFKKNTPEIVFARLNQNPLPSLSQTSNLPQIAKSENNLTCLTAQLFESQIIVLVLLCTNCCTGSLRGGLQ